jgi:pilus assembly protein Flp/PilA
MLFSLRIKDFLKREDGPTAVEYAVMLAMIVAVCAAAISALGTSSKGAFEKATAGLQNVGGSTSGFTPARGSYTSPGGDYNYNPTTGVFTVVATGQTFQGPTGLASEAQDAGWTIN